MVLKDAGAAASGERHRMAASDCQVGYSSERVPHVIGARLPESLGRYQTRAGTKRQLAAYRRMQKSTLRGE
ncbi:hypothetical protein EYF80_016086 [Liparis tanakae]|uniref:Uncharacterized protein n=1 Tax=Liparis tanakae TaxID=230148 RepID=A0A4Z2I6M7_9TELE|nr:hypothetical protein EYF80_016086 [Liparis tanakae]